MAVRFSICRLISLMTALVMLLLHHPDIFAQPSRIRSLEFSKFSIPAKATTVKEVSDQDASAIHPDFGFLPFDRTPCTDCQELLGKRNATSREFVSMDGRHFYQYGAGALNYKDDENGWREIN
ncbi:MAG: hypothetical protein ACKOA1_01295, partial [Bacteroidota bacterium]